MPDKLAVGTPQRLKTVHRQKSHTSPVNVFSHVPFLPHLPPEALTMERVLRVNNTDQRITYNNDWKLMPISGLGQNGTYSYASTLGAHFFVMFRGIVTPNGLAVTSSHPHDLWYGYPLSGTSVRFYGRIGGGGNFQFRLDGNITSMSLNDTNFDSGPTLVWNANNLRDADHQLYVYVNSLQENGSIVVDYLEYVVPSLHFVTRIVFQDESCFQV